jgi:hypothetical protein
MPSAARKGKPKSGGGSHAKKAAHGHAKPAKPSAKGAKPPARAAAAPAKPGKPAPVAATAGKTVAATAGKAGAPASKSGAPGPGAKTGAASAAGSAAAGAGKTVPSPRPAGGRPGSGGKKQRKSSLAQRMPGFQPGDLLVPGGAQGPDEVQYFLRGVVAAEHAAIDAGVSELITKKATPEGEAERERGELTRYAEGLSERFESGSIEPLLPMRAPARRNFAGVVERAKHRRREIGAFLRGLDLGRTETSHMDSHGEASLQSLMEWAARLENLAEADEPDQADYAMFHRGLDQLDNTTEALIIDVELTLRRLRDRVRAS